MGAMIALVLGITFGLLSLLHFAWALGIKWGFDASLPTTEEGKSVIDPKPRESLIVAIGLAFFSVFYCSKYFMVPLTPNETIETIISWVMPCIFILRSIGDFKYFGFFKKVKSTSFADLDTKLIIPLCLLLAFLGFLLELNG